MTYAPIPSDGSIAYDAAKIVFEKGGDIKQTAIKLKRLYEKAIEAFEEDSKVKNKIPKE